MALPPEGAASVSPPLPAAAGELVAGRYELFDVVGAGGMGVVYRARDRRLQRVVAVKVVTVPDPGAGVRLHDEAVVLARLRHPSVVQVYDGGEHDGLPFVVTELVDGPSLRDRLTAGPLPPTEVATLGRELAGALAAAHGAGVIHRDLKPGNVLLPPNRPPRLVDFGIASVVEDADATLTRPAAVLGTVPYLSPEQVQGASATPASDVHGLGLVLLEALTGRQAYPGTSAATLARRMVEPPSVPDDLPTPWPGLLRSMTALDPSSRPSAAEVAAVLASSRLDRPVSAAAPTTVLPPAAPTQVASALVRRGDRHGRRRHLVPLLGLLLLVALALGLLVAGGDDPDSSSPPSSTTMPAAPVESVTPTTEPAPTTSSSTTTTPPSTTAPGDKGKHDGEGARKGPGKADGKRGG